MQPQGSSSVHDLLALGLQHHRAGRIAQAEHIYVTILQSEPDHADTLHLLGVLAHQTGRNDRAVELIGRAIAASPQVPSFHNNLGNALNAQGRLEEAAASYAQALTLQPDYAEGHFNLGVVRQLQNRLEEAAACYRRALGLRPAHAEAHLNLGNTLRAQGKLDDALAAYQQALIHRPHYAEAHSNQGNALAELGRAEDAAACYARALSCNPQHAETHHNLGNLSLQHGRLDEAVASFRRALSLKPGLVEAHSYLGTALFELGQPHEALASFERALQLDPDRASARLGRALAVIPVLPDSAAESRGAIQAFTRSLDELGPWSAAHREQLGSIVGSHQPFYLAYRPGDVSAPLRRYGDLMCAAAAARRRTGTPSQGGGTAARKRLRLVVVSSHIRQHPVWDVVLRGMIAHLDRGQFEIFLYHTSALTDAETSWARERVERFVQGPYSPQRWMDEMAEDRPDAIFYPEVGMDPTTCALAALRLAPLQVAGWGHPVTTGLPSMDVFVSGELLEGRGAERHYREHLVRLPGTGVCTEWRASSAVHWSGPERQAGVVRFAICQQPIKFDPADDALLARIAKAAGPCEFWLVSPDKQHWAAARLRARLAAAFAAEGLNPEEHLRVTPWMAREQFLGFLDEMDIYLDCPAFSGYTTAWQALIRGLPVVTLEGEFLRQRLAAGLLRQLGVTAGIAASRDEYLQIAARLAGDRREFRGWEARRQAIRRAAARADGNRAAVGAFGRTLKEMVERRGMPGAVRASQ